MAELEKSFASNTCRCTGFRPILDTIQSFAVDASPELCQRVRDIEELGISREKNSRICKRICSTKSDCTDWSIIEGVQTDSTIALNFGNCKFYKVFDEREIFNILDKHGVDSYMFVDGNTGKGKIGCLKVYLYYSY